MSNYTACTRPLNSGRPLAELKHLTTLSLRGHRYLTNLELLAALAGLEHLTTLSLSMCEELTSLEGVAGLTELTTLDLSGCTRLASLEGVAGLERLTTLDLSWCERLTSLEGVAELKHLTTLSLRAQGHPPGREFLAALAEFLAALAGFKRLTTLDLGGWVHLTSLEGLAGLTELTTLDLTGCYNLTSLEALAGLERLTTLSLRGCGQLENLELLAALAGRTRLTTLNLSKCEQLTSLEGVAALTELTTLDLSECTRLWSLEGLAGLKRLTTLSLRSCKGLTSLEGLAGLTELTTLDLTGCYNLTSLEGVAGLERLTTLDLTGCGQLTNLERLTALAGLKRLATLSLKGCPQPTSLEGLSGLTRLTTLDLSSCVNLTSLEGVAGLTELTTLDLSWCERLTNVTPISELPKLRELNLTCCKSLQTFAPLQNLLTVLSKLDVYGTRFRDLHPSVCGDNSTTNSLESVRLYFAALGSTATPDAEVKVFVLGNGRTGKTKLIGRLRLHSFDSIPEGSTHGVHLVEHLLPEGDDLPHPVRLNIWDFGGQDVYHGTHALFLCAPAVYVLIYSADNENENESEHNGIPIKNRLIKYWFDFIRQVPGKGKTVNCPVLIVQGKCDRLANENPEPPYTPKSGFPHLSRLLHVSTIGRGRGLEHFQERLREAVGQLLEAYPQPPFPTSWASVRQELRDMQGARSCRTLALSDFADLCQKHRCPGDEHVLRDALNQMGVVFYREGIFDDQIILDQAWALEAVYTIFSRNEGFQRQVRKNGRFYRQDLDHYFWHKYPFRDQQTFLSFMIHCDICFQASGSIADDSAEYVAPDLLQPWGESEEEDYAWQLHLPPLACVTVEFVLLHDGILRAFLSRIGRVAGTRARYWKFGCHIHDQYTESQASIRAVCNKLEMRAWYGNAPLLLQLLLNKLDGLSAEPPAVVWSSLKRSTSRRDDLGTSLTPITALSDRKLVNLCKVVHDYLRQLRLFYKIGLELDAGARSFSEVAKKLGYERSYISMIITDLEEKVFKQYFGVQEVKLRDKAGRGHKGGLSDFGRLAWKATREYLEHYDIYPRPGNDPLV